MSYGNYEKYFYSEVQFNSLMSILDFWKEKEFAEEFHIKKIYDKILEYAIFVPEEDDSTECIRINWFPNELSNLFHFFFFGTNEISDFLKVPYGFTNYFEDVRIRYIQQHSDPDFYTKYKIKPINIDGFMKLNNSRMKELLTKKGRAIMNVLGFKTTGVEFWFDDIPSATFFMHYEQKTKSTTYQFIQNAKEWIVYQTIQNKKQKTASEKKMSVNWETLEIKDFPATERPFTEDELEENVET